MSVVDLQARITNSWEEFNKLKRDSNSKIFVDKDLSLDNNSPSSLGFTVGASYICDGVLKTIPSEGIKIPPQTSVTIEVAQQIAVPYNMFGMIMGIGVNIFRKGIVSIGKIDPGFNGKLKITYMNTFSEAIVFKPNDLIACGTFWNTDFVLDYELQNYNAQVASVEGKSSRQKFAEWIKNNWYSIITSVIAIGSLIVSIVKG